MKNIRDFLYDLFKWDFRTFIKALIGTLIFSIAMNIFIVPMGLYTGGVLGISQLIRTFFIKVLHWKFSFDVAGLLNFLFNIPLFILAYSKVSKTFFSRTLLCVGFQTICLSVIPTLSNPIVSDMLTSTLIGGLLAGLGCGITLSTSASGGGTEIIGVVASMKNRNLSVGQLGLYVNVVIYGICGVIFGLETMIYSIICSVFSTIMIDRTHEQNICSTAFIFTKKKPGNVIDFIEEELNRGATTWEASGGYNGSKTYITYVALSKYELQRLERNLNDLDESAFLVKTDGVGIKGDFKKNL